METSHEVETLGAELLQLYNEILGFHCEAKSSEIEKVLNQYSELRKSHNALQFLEIKELFLGKCALKFPINQQIKKRFNDYLFSLGVKINSEEKKILLKYTERRNWEKIIQFLENKQAEKISTKQFLEQSNYPSEKEIIEHIKNELLEPTKTRKDATNLSARENIHSALLGLLGWCSFDPEKIHSSFSEQNKYQFLKSNNEIRFNRSRAAVVITIDQKIADEISDYAMLRDVCCRQIAYEYQNMSNHSYLALIIEPIMIETTFVQAKLSADLNLYSEKFHCHKLESGYFDPKKIFEVTKSYIPNIMEKNTNFEIANQGFEYRDTFVLGNVKTSSNETTLCTIFELNRAEEAIIHCPECRSDQHIKGNSYPKFGVRSFECKNLLCPGRSYRGRGFRFDFRGILKQSAILDAKSKIPHDLIKKWTKDVQYGQKSSDFIEMFILFYSIPNDGVVVINCESNLDSIKHRNISREDFQVYGDEYDAFWNSDFFNRFAIGEVDESNAKAITIVGKSTLVNGDSRNCITSLNFGFEGAVTSPPYYNDREYSTWPNIYCYLEDMYLVAKQVFASLLPGSVYMYNIFDTFGNEASIATSAMGDKRLILAAYSTYLHEKVGFDLISQICWDKGEIEGKRAFNQGNDSPFYQAPFNCWEHVLVFRKPGGKESDEEISSRLPGIFRCDPVKKIGKGGINRHGHSAPFPEDIPNLLLKLLEGGPILDPYGGSGTTSRAGQKKGIETVCVEMNDDYYQLMVAKCNDALSQTTLPLE